MHILALLIGLISILGLAATAGGEAPLQDHTPQDGPPKPAPELKQLEAFVGTWDATVEMMGQTSKGTETCRLGLGGFFLITDHDGSFMGMPFKGHGVTGWDAASKSFQGIWADSSGSPMTEVKEARFSRDGTVYSASAGGLDFSGKPAQFRHVTTFKGKDNRIYDTFQITPDGEQLVMKIRYTRQK